MQTSLGNFCHQSLPRGRSWGGKIWVAFHTCFCGPAQPFRIEKVAGMVEELLGKADPEHQTLQNFRTSRTTNDARMLQFFRLSG